MKGNRFFRKKGKIGCLLVHGLTSCAEEMEGIASYLHSKGFSVLGTLLKGHNTSIEDLASTNWRDWYSAVEHDFDFLRKRCSKVYVIGLSIGAALSMHLAANKKINGLVLLAPAIFYINPLAKFTPFLKYFKKYKTKDYSRHYPGRKEAFFDIVDEKAALGRIAYKKVPLASLASAMNLIKIVKKEIRRIKCPTLVIHSLSDHTIKPKSAQYIFDNLKSCQEDKKIIYIKKSGHVISVDYDKGIICSEINNFIRKYNKNKSAEQ